MDTLIKMIAKVKESITGEFNENHSRLDTFPKCFLVWFWFC